MLHIIWLILKIVGLIIAIVLGLCLLVIAAVLFIPIRYSVEAAYQEKPTAHIRAHWLFHALSFSFVYDKKSAYEAKVFGFSVIGQRADERKIRKEKAKSRKHKATTQKQQPQKKTDVKQMPDKIPKQMPEQIKQPAANVEQDKKKNFSEDIHEHQTHTEAKARNEKKSYFSKLKQIIFRIYDKIKNIIQRMIHAKESLSDKVRSLKKHMENSEYKELVLFLLGQAGQLLRKMKPTKYRIYVKFGLDDPYETGQIAMYAAVLYGLFGLDMEIIPDFDQEVLEGLLFMKGRCTVFSIAWIALRIYRNQLFRKIILKRDSK